MPTAYEGTDIISYFHKVEIYHTATPYIISRKRYIIEKNNKLWYNQLDKLEFDRGRKNDASRKN